MISDEIAPGVAVLVTDAEGVEHPAIAASCLEGGRGHSFPVYWVLIERHDGTGKERVPWPAKSVRVDEEKP